MSKVTMNEETHKAQLNLKQSIIKQLKDYHVFVYKVNWNDLECGEDAMQSITIEYRDHDEVEITEDAND